MNQDELLDDNILITAIYPIRQFLMSEGAETDDLVDDLITGQNDNVVAGLREFIDNGWKKHLYSEDQTAEDFGDLPRSDQGEMLREWAYRNVAGDLLVASIATPVPSYRKGSTGYSFSWGYTYTGLVGATTLQGIYKAASKWKKSRHTEAKKDAA